MGTSDMARTGRRAVSGSRSAWDRRTKTKGSVRCRKGDQSTRTSTVRSRILSSAKTRDSSAMWVHFEVYTASVTKYDASLNIRHQPRLVVRQRAELTL